MKYTLLFVFCLGVNTTIFCQGTSSTEQKNLVITTYADGIQFDHEHTWEELLKKAKDENKLIYVDAYTTWCGPCKQMSKEVYTKKEVGDAYNANFISFKAQIDTSDNDNEYVKSHYQDFKAIATKYNVEVYPTHLFINGDGEMVHKAVGGMPAEKFIELAANASNPEKQFGTLNKKFVAGERSPDLLFNLSKAAFSAYENKLGKIIANEYILTQQDLFTEKNIRFIYEVVKSTDETGFTLIKNNPKKFDTVLGEGSARKKLRSIGIYKMAYPKIYDREKAPDFAAIYKEIKTNLGNEYADEITQYSKLIYYLSFKKYKELGKELVVYMNKFGTKELNANDLNSFAWAIFENIDDKSILQTGLQCALQSIQKESGSANTDTVANLYFKLGNKAKAIEYEEKALALAKQAGEDTAEYEKVLENFRK
jgi:thioredoxin-related protein